MKVLHVLGPLKPSGMERMLVSAADAFEGFGVEAVVISRAPEVQSTYAVELRAAGYLTEFEPQDLSWAGRARWYRNMIDRHNIDVVHLHTEANYLQMVLLLWQSLRYRKAIVRTVHSNFPARGLWRLRRWIQAVVGDKLTSSVVACSTDVASNERSTINRKSTVINNWVDPRFFELRLRRKQREGHTRSAKLAVIVGNCAPVKNHTLALRAVLHSSYDLLHLGDETLASEEEKGLLSQFREEDRLVESGVSAPDEALLEGSCFLIPSLREGFSVAMAEALAVGIPILAADRPGFQWAKDVTGVTLLPLEEQVWTNMLKELKIMTSLSDEIEIDLRPERGAKQYAELYARAKHNDW